jgi:2-polyprenyl-3-methyl-5-hydroxy-6-metoxy-1,4-benzoquinol methylase
MVTGKVADYRPTDRMYMLPAEHARWLTRKATPENLAVTSQWISVMGCVESRIVDKFKSGGGVPYECFERFHETMAEESAQTVVAALQDHILPLSGGLADRLEEGSKALDVGCGSGRAACAMAKAFPASLFTGYDLCEDAIAAADVLAQEQGLSNVTFLVKDITELEEPEAYDLVTAFDIVHDQKDPAAVLANIHSVLKVGGTFLMQDIAGSPISRTSPEPTRSTSPSIRAEGIKSGFRREEGPVPCGHSTGPSCSSRARTDGNSSRSRSRSAPGSRSVNSIFSSRVPSSPAMKVHSASICRRTGVGS